MLGPETCIVRSADDAMAPRVRAGCVLLVVGKQFGVFEAVVAVL